MLRVGSCREVERARLVESVEARRGGGRSQSDRNCGSWVLVPVLELSPFPVLGRVALRQRHENVERGVIQGEQAQLFQGPAEAAHACPIPMADLRQHRLT